MDRGVYVSREEAENTSFGEALERYLKEVTSRNKEAKQEGIRIRALLNHDLSKRSLASIRGADVAAYGDERLDQGKSPVTVD